MPNSSGNNRRSFNTNALGNYRDLVAFFANVIAVVRLNNPVPTTKIGIIQNHFQICPTYYFRYIIKVKMPKIVLYYFCRSECRRSGEDFHIGLQDFSSNLALMYRFVEFAQASDKRGDNLAISPLSVDAGDIVPISASVGTVRPNEDVKVDFEFEMTSESITGDQIIWKSHSP